MKERFVVQGQGILARIDRSICMIDQIMTTPLPLPYAHLCKLLLFIFMLSLPFFIDEKAGWLANTFMTWLITLALLGVDALATEIENPFGDDANDHDILECVGMLESEAMEALALLGDRKARRRFCWRTIPDFISSHSARSLRRQLAFVDAAVPEVVSREYNPMDIEFDEEGGSVGEDMGDSLVQSVGSSIDLL